MVFRSDSGCTPARDDVRTHKVFDLASSVVFQFLQNIMNACKRRLCMIGHKVRISETRKFGNYPLFGILKELNQVCV